MRDTFSEGVFKTPMAAGNAESATNGVTGVGGIEIQARVFCDSNVDSVIHVFRFSTRSHRSLRCDAFPAAISFRTY